MVARTWDDYIASLLLAGSWRPVTECIMFAEASLDEVGAWFRDGYGAAEMRLYAMRPEITRVQAATLPDMLSHLLPLQGTPQRMLAVATRNPRWTAIFDSSWRGMDPGSLHHWLLRDGINAVSITAAAHTPRRERGATYGARRFIVSGPWIEGIYELGIRATGQSNWKFNEPIRTPPQTLHYDPDAKTIPRKFTHEHLTACAAELGIHPFDDDFYDTTPGGILCQRYVPPSTPQGFGEFTLAQAQGLEDTAFDIARRERIAELRAAGLLPEKKK